MAKPLRPRRCFGRWACWNNWGFMLGYLPRAECEHGWAVLGIDISPQGLFHPGRSLVVMVWGHLVEIDIRTITVPRPTSPTPPRRPQ